MAQNTTRVCLAIPSMGYCDAMAYCNRLINWMHLGQLEMQQKCIEDLIAVLKDEPDKAVKDRIMTKFFERTKLYSKIPDKGRFEFFFAVTGRIFTPFAREHSAKMALEADCDYLFFVDDDMMCPDDIFEKLYAHDVDIVAPLAFTRNYPHKPVIYSLHEGWDEVNRKSYYDNIVVWNYPKDRLVEVDAVGFGAALIKMDVIRKMKPPYFMSSSPTGEDILFCYNAKKVGARVFVDTATKLGHIGPPIEVTEDYVIKKRQEDQPDFAKIHKVYDKYTKHGTLESVYVHGD